eukprot:924220_1
MELTMTTFVWYWTAVTTVLALGLTRKFWKKRGSFLIKGREPKLVLVTLLTTITVWSFNAIRLAFEWTQTACIISRMFRLSVGTRGSDVYTLRLYVLYYRILLIDELQQRHQLLMLDDEEIDRHARTWMVRHKHLISVRSQIIYLAVMWSVRILLGVYGTFFEGAAANLSCMDSFPWIAYSITFLLFAWVIFCGVKVIWITRDSPDNYYIVEECKWIVVILPLMLLLHFLIAREYGDISRAVPIFEEILGRQIVFAISCMVPLYRQWKLDNDTYQWVPPAKTLTKLLNDRDGYQAFRIFLKREFSQHWLDFHENFIQFRSQYSLRSNSRNKSYGHKIYDEFLSPQSPCQIPLSDNITHQLNRELKQSERADCEISRVIFNRAYGEVVILLQESFMRYTIYDKRQKAELFRNRQPALPNEENQYSFSSPTLPNSESIDSFSRLTVSKSGSMNGVSGPKSGSMSTLIHPVRSKSEIRSSRMRPVISKSDGRTSLMHPVVSKSGSMSSVNMHPDLYKSENSRSSRMRPVISKSGGMSSVIHQHIPKSEGR